MAKKEKISVSLDKGLMIKIRELALKENRNVSNIIETILFEHINQ